MTEEQKDIVAHLALLVGPFARKVQPIYALLGWTWGDDDLHNFRPELVSPSHIPTVGQIEAALHRKVQALGEFFLKEEDHEYFRISSGGLEVFLMPRRKTEPPRSVMASISK